jgi:hypothetical protein
MIAKPASISAAAIGATSSGLMPRRMATSGQRARAVLRSIIALQSLGQEMEPGGGPIRRHGQGRRGPTERQRLTIAPGQGFAADQMDRAGDGRGRRQFMADQQILTDRPAGPPPADRPSDPGCARRTDDAAGRPRSWRGPTQWRRHDRPGPLLVRRRHQPAEDRMLAQDGEALAGHVGLKAGDPAALDAHPFRMGAGQADEPGGRARSPSAPRICTSSPRITSGTPSERQLRPGASQAWPGQSKSSGIRACRISGSPAGQADIGRLAPALPAADHAGQQHQPLDVEPGADLLAQHGIEAAVGHAQDAARRGAWRRGSCRRRRADRPGSSRFPNRRQSCSGSSCVTLFIRLLGATGR